MLTARNRIAARPLIWSLVLGLLLLAAATTGDAAPNFPALTGRVVDQADILSATVESSLTRQLKGHEDQTSNQVVVVTLGSLQGGTIEEFGYQLGRHWGIGQEGKNNGVLLIVAPKERKVRIEVGYGLEGSLTDAIAKLIIEREITPAFRKGNYDQGVSAGVEAILAAIGGSYKAPKAKRQKATDNPVLLIAFLLFFGFAFYIFWASARNGGGGWHSGSGRSRGGGGFGGGGGGFSGGGGSFGGGGSSGGW